MTTHRETLGGLAQLRQFFLYRITPHPTKPGKTEKTPTGRDGQTHGSEDARYWMSYDEAVAACPADGWAVGVAITERDPYWFIDIDSCVDDAGQLNDVARTVVAAFPGAFIEYSTSGKGIHIIGRGVWSPHRSKRPEWGLEFYTEHRGCALNLRSGVSGSADTDHTHILQQWFCRLDVMGPRPLSELGDGPRAEWVGPADDDELLRRALTSQSAANKLGVMRASFADLWNADLPALARTYPSDTPGHPDLSSCDMALASHLAFWTGCDAARMHRLMMRSGLVRDKWHRPDYLIERTIPGAIGMQGNVLTDRPIEDVAAPPGDAMPSIEAATRGTFLGATDQATLFAGCVYVMSENKIWSGKYNELLRREQFDAMYGGYTFSIDAENRKTTNKPFDAFINSQINTIPRVPASCFKPTKPTGAIIDGKINTYHDDSGPATYGADVSIFTDHIARLLPDPFDAAVLLAFLAACVQHKGRKLAWAPVLQGVPGNGKTFITEAMRYAVGDKNYGVISSKDLSSQFTGWLVNKVFIVAQDVAINRGDTTLIEAIKPIISDLYQRTEVKGGAQETREITANFMVTTNRRDAMKFGANERRWAPLFTAQQTLLDLEYAGMGVGSEYFTRLWGWFYAGGAAAIKGYLLSYQIPHALDPTGGANRAPITSCWKEAIEASAGTIEGYLLDAVREGRLGFRGGFVAQNMAEKYIAEELGHKYSRKFVTDALLEIGYIPHPALNHGRVDNAVGGYGRVKLWVKPRTIQADRTLSPVIIGQLFLKSNPDGGSFQVTPPITAL